MMVGLFLFRLVLFHDTAIPLFTNSRIIGIWRKGWVHNILCFFEYYCTTRMIWFLFPLSTSASSSQHKIFIAFLRVLSLGVNGIAVSFFGLWRSFWFWVSFESFSFYTLALKFTKKWNFQKQIFFSKCQVVSGEKIFNSLFGYSATTFY